MMDDKTKTQQKVFLQENFGKVLAMSLMDFFDNNRPEGKMCLSNDECKNIYDAIALGDWDMIFRYIEKYIKK